MQPASPAATVLVVDDDEGLRLLMQDALESAGYAVAAVASGAAALEWLEVNRPELMLLDLKLRDADADAIVQRLKETDRAVPFIIVTGQGDERVAVKMMKQGALDYLVKDTGMMERLPAIVGRALEQLQRDRALAAAEMALQESKQQVLAISEREQRRFGQDLHDGLGQQLTAIELLCQSLKEDLRAHAPGLQKQVETIGRFLREAIGQTRSLARGLAPVNLESEGLMDALGELARRTAALGRVRCRFECPSPVLVQDSGVSGHLFRIGQEAVNNALKHARADEIVIRLFRRNGTLHLEIADDGKGLPKKRTGGMGFNVMRHRATLIGADLQIRSQPGLGVTIICKLPETQ